MTRRTLTAALTVVLATAGLVMSVVAGLAAPEPTRDQGRPEGAERTAREQPGRGSAKLPRQPPPRPLRLSVPSVGIALPVRPVGVAPDGQMQLPTDPAVLGWYRFGPAPTQPGSAVLAAHVDSRDYGVGPLAWLREVEVGDALVVRTARGAVAHTVTAVDRYAKAALPASIFARTGPSRLRVVTCGGEFDEDTGSYRENLVVTAEPRS